MDAQVTPIDRLLTIHKSEVFSSILFMEDTEQRGPGIENGSEWSWNGPFRSDRSNRKKRSTSKGGPLFLQLSQLD